MPDASLSAKMSEPLSDPKPGLLRASQPPLALPLLLASDLVPHPTCIAAGRISARMSLVSGNKVAKAGSRRWQLSCGLVTMRLHPVGVAEGPSRSCRQQSHALANEALVKRFARSRLLQKLGISHRGVRCTSSAAARHYFPGCRAASKYCEISGPCENRLKLIAPSPPVPPRRLPDTTLASKAMSPTLPSMPGHSISRTPSVGLQILRPDWQSLLGLSIECT
jgi:hypothetical protein